MQGRIGALPLTFRRRIQHTIAAFQHTPLSGSSSAAAAAASSSPSAVQLRPLSTMSESPKKELEIQIISDNICPFCYLGKKKIEAAVAKLPPDVKVTYDWRPFQLDETLPTPGTDKLERYKLKFGAARIEPMLQQMKANGRAWGIEFEYGGKIGNTVNSHRLVEFSKQASQGGGKLTDSIVNTLFDAYFTKNRDISDIEVLVDIGVKAGLPATADELRTFLRGNDLRKEVLEAVHDAKNAEISGVPHFVIGGKYQVSGAQDPEAFTAIFKKLGVTA